MENSLLDYRWYLLIMLFANLSNISTLPYIVKFHIKNIPILPIGSLEFCKQKLATPARIWIVLNCSGLTREYTVFQNQTPRSITLHINCISQYPIMGKILRGLSNESVWLKSLAEHDNVDKFCPIYMLSKWFHQYAFITDPNHIAPQE